MMRRSFSLRVRFGGYIALVGGLFAGVVTTLTAQQRSSGLSSPDMFLADFARQQYWVDSYGYPGCNGSCSGGSCCRIVLEPY